MHLRLAYHGLGRMTDIKVTNFAISQGVSRRGVAGEFFAGKRCLSEASSFSKKNSPATPQPAPSRAGYNKNRSNQLDGNGSPLTTTNTQRGNATLAAGLLQGVDQGDDQA